MGTRGKINAILCNIKINLQKLADVCGYELPTNLRNCTQKELTEVEIFLNVLWGGTFYLKYPVVELITYIVYRPALCLKKWTAATINMAFTNYFWLVQF